jgi:hypothetical protein
MPETTTAAPPRCDANAATVAFDWGERFVKCEARRGLRSFTDAAGETRWYCPAIGHRFNVERRFGLAPETCSVCGKATDDTAIRLSLGKEVGLMCWRCQDRFADDEPSGAWDPQAYDA